MKIDKTVQTYDRIAPQFHRAHLRPDFWRPEFNAFKRLVPGKKVIDIGCGTGRDAVLFTKARFDYVGIDASRGMLSVARKRARAGKFILMSFYDLQFPAQTFDGFWAAASLLHVPKKRIGTVLRAIRRILKPHGIGFIRVKEKTRLEEGPLKEEKWGGIERYFAFYAQTEFAGVLQRSGLRVIKSYTKRENDPNRTNWLCYFVKKAP
ncbi:class I SAM-dependent methyltransferase [Candidatus Parcubacteria bacterium]|nr:class I SAM-dependent methyltransferase [Candidatus Parcubacteria bacterium]MBI4098916.1 class I SAM-dependent methyltransferase [Candidatus Parcubacteria bacterium]MBI4385485.1 class I SAM-dependent methyltransferase [Candidatus Parcubacteria bacterium]